MNAARDGCAACACDVMDVGFVMLLVLVHVTCRWRKAAASGSNRASAEARRERLIFILTVLICMRWTESVVHTSP